MDREKSLGGGAVFPLGEKNEAFAKYFIGQSYLSMLTTERVPIGNVTFERAAATTGISTTRAARSCSSPAAEDIIRNGARSRKNFTPETLLIYLPKLNTGTAPLPTAGSRI